MPVEVEARTASTLALVDQAVPVLPISFGSSRRENAVAHSYAVVSADHNNKVIVDGPYMWDGPQPGSGVWKTDDGGRTWKSAKTEEVFAGTRYDPGNGCGLIAVDDMATEGYSWPPPPQQDSDGDGVPDDQDADPNDSAVQ